MAVIIHTRDLWKRFGTVSAVAGITLDVQTGECYGLLGPNGAGKTTAIRMIAGVSPVTAGDLWVADLDVRRQARRIRSVLGVVPQEDNLDPDLTVFQNLLVYSRYHGLLRHEALSRIQENLAFMQLQDKSFSPVDTLSGGMKRRLLIARALINRPRILILDEPTTGLDPQARHLVWQKLRQLKAQGVTILLSTQNMEEASRLCDRLAILHEGRILAEGAPAALVERYAGRDVVEVRVEDDRREAILGCVAHRPGLKVEAVDDTLYMFAQDIEGDASLADLHLAGEQVVYRRANLEDVFLRLTGRGLSE